MNDWQAEMQRSELFWFVCGQLFEVIRVRNIFSAFGFPVYQLNDPQITVNKFYFSHVKNQI